MCNFAIFTYLAFCQISPYLGPLYEEFVGDNGFILVSFCRSNLVAPISRKKRFVKINIITRKHSTIGQGLEFFLSISAAFSQDQIISVSMATNTKSKSLAPVM